MKTLEEITHDARCDFVEEHYRKEEIYTDGINMNILRRVLKLCGQMKIRGHDGKSVLWVYDHAKDEPRRKHEMTRDEWAESEKAKWKLIKESFKSSD